MFLFGSNADAEPSQRRGSGRAARSTSPDGTRSNWFEANLTSLRSQSQGDDERSNSTNSIRRSSAGTLECLPAPPGGRLTRTNSAFFRRPANSSSLLDGAPLPAAERANSRKSFRGFVLSRDSGDDSGGSAPVWGSFMRQRACSTRFDLGTGDRGMPGGAFDKGLAMRRASTMRPPWRTEENGGSRHETTGKAATLHAEPSGEIVVINRRANSRLTQLIPRLLRMHPMGVIFAGAVLYTCVAIVFAAIFYGFGEACFAFAEVSFTYVEVLWLSVHTLTTVGFGSAVPICAGPQVMVLLESYLGLLVQAMIGAYVVFVFMRSRARVRFSRHCLVARVPAAELEAAARLTTNGSGEGSGHGRSVAPGELVYEVRFRLVRESFTEVRDARIYVQARYSVPSGEPEADGAFSREKVLGPDAAGKVSDDDTDDNLDDGQTVFPPSSPNKALNRAIGRRFSSGCGVGGLGLGGSVSGRDSFASVKSSASSVVMKGALEQRAELVLQTEQMSSLDYWEVVHRIDANSPLHSIKNLLATHLKSIDVSITAYDPAFNQPVKLYARYASHEILHNYRFEPMDATSEGTTVITVDHSKLDLIKKQKERPPPTKQRRGSADNLTKSLVGSLASLRSRMRRGSDDMLPVPGVSEASASAASSAASTDSAETAKRRSRTSITSGLSHLKRSMSLDTNDAGWRASAATRTRRPSDEDSPSGGNSSGDEVDSARRPTPPKRSSSAGGSSSSDDGKRHSLPALHLRFSRRARSKESMLDGSGHGSGGLSSRRDHAREAGQSRSSPLVPEGMRREDSRSRRKTSFADESNEGVIARMMSEAEGPPATSDHPGSSSSSRGPTEDAPAAASDAHRKRQKEEVPQELEA